MKKISATQRVIAIFHGEPLDKAVMLLELAQGIVDVRLGVNTPALSGKPVKPVKRRKLTPEVALPNVQGGL